MGSASRQLLARGSRGDAAPAERDGPPCTPGHVLVSCRGGPQGPSAPTLRGAPLPQGWGTRAERAWGFGGVTVDGTAVSHDLRLPPWSPRTWPCVAADAASVQNMAQYSQGAPAVTSLSTCQDPDNKPLSLWAWFWGQGS